MQKKTKSTFTLSDEVKALLEKVTKETRIKKTQLVEIAVTEKWGQQKWN